MKIGEMAHRAAVPTKTIRYYEEIGLLPEPDRAHNGYRDYDEEAVQRLRFIRDAQATGLTLAEIGSILDIKAAGGQSCHHVLHLMERHVSAIDRRIDTLVETRSRLVALTERARSMDPADCTDPNRCQTVASGAGPPERDVAAALHSAPVSHRH
jgi:DNA-binding transcriptional MerR regulator